MNLGIKIKVIGVGGSGCNAIARMAKDKKNDFPRADLISVNTDNQDLEKKQADLKIRIGRKATQGLGAGMNPWLGKKAAEEQEEELRQVIAGADIVFVATGLGGGTGSGASPVVAEIAKSSGALTVGVVTLPFVFEGKARAEIAKKARGFLEERVDSLIVIPNNNLLKSLPAGVLLNKAFEACDEILRQAVKSVSGMMLFPGIINVNFADVKSVMKDSGAAFFGLGVASGEDRAVEAAKAALFSPLLGVSIAQAKGILFNISGGPDISLFEINEAAKIITKTAAPNAKVIFGASTDEKLKKGEIKVTVIATGF